MATKMFTVGPEKLAILIPNSEGAKDGALIIDPLGSRVNKCSVDLFRDCRSNDSSDDGKSTDRRFCLPQVLHQKKVRKVADVAEHVVLFVSGDSGTGHP